jgi:prepilin-type N-terminal cleavage/methylation domain-containing protein
MYWRAHRLASVTSNGHVFNGRGVTLIELLVVVAIVGLLAALLLPAVAFVREASRRSLCLSHLRQLSLATINYQDVHRCYPPGRIPSFDPRDGGAGYPCKSSNTDRTPLLFILPFLEEPGLYDGHNQLLASYSPENRTAFTRPPRIYHCPSDNGERIRSVVFLRFPIPLTQPLEGNYDVARTSYVASFGTVRTVGMPAFGVACKSDPTAISQQDGLFNDRHPLSDKDVVDGLCKTVLFTERATALLDVDRDPVGNDARFGWWFIGNVGDSLGTATCPPNYAGGSSLRRAQTASSGHGGGVHVVFGDGSTHWVSDSIDSWRPGDGEGPADATFNGKAWVNLPARRVWQAMWTRAGNDGGM